MLPICYEEGITAGCDNDCANLLNVATENYIKELLSNILAHIRSNGDHYVKTAAYRRQLQQEENAWLQGTVARYNGSLLPKEGMAAERRRPLEIDDMRLALYMGDTSIGQSPLLTERLASGDYVKAEEIRNMLEDTCTDNAGVFSRSRSDVFSSGKYFAAANHHVADFASEWAGSARSDRQALGFVLDDCLSVS